MSTIHNPVNFEPNDYSVVRYIDNHPPEYCGGNVEGFLKAREKWRAEIIALDVQGGIHRCCHCGNSNVRYVTVCRHNPSGRNVCFGTDCTERLGFEGADAFKAAHIRTHAHNMAVYAKLHVQREKLLAANPGLKEALASESNSFILDVARKFQQYAELSEAQIRAVIEAARRDAERTERRAAEKAVVGPVPTGKRITFEGKLVSRRTQEGMYGIQHKCLIVLDNGSKIWMTEPVACNVELQGRVTIRATVEASKEDPSFGFASRPHFVKKIV